MTRGAAQRIVRPESPPLDDPRHRPIPKNKYGTGGWGTKSGVEEGPCEEELRYAIVGWDEV
jgi:hypothetical protein